MSAYGVSPMLPFVNVMSPRVPL